MIAFILLGISLYFKMGKVWKHSTPEDNTRIESAEMTESEVRMERTEDRKALGQRAVEFLLAAAYILPYFWMGVLVLCEATCTDSISSRLVLPSVNAFLAIVLIVYCCNLFFRFHRPDSKRMTIFSGACCCFVALAICAALTGTIEGLSHKWNVHALGDEHHLELQRLRGAEEWTIEDSAATMARVLGASFGEGKKVCTDIDIPERTAFAMYSYVVIFMILAATTGTLFVLERLLICEKYGSEEWPVTAAFPTFVVVMVLLLHSWYNPYALVYGQLYGVVTSVGKPLGAVITAEFFAPGWLSFLLMPITTLASGIWWLLSQYAMLQFNDWRASKKAEAKEEADKRKRSEQSAHRMAEREHAAALNEEYRGRRKRK